MSDGEASLLGQESMVFGCFSAIPMGRDGMSGEPKIDHPIQIDLASKCQSRDLNQAGLSLYHTL